MGQTCYPISYSYIPLFSEKRGTEKRFYFYVLNADNGKSTVITRWGFKGSFGDISVAHFETIKEALDFVENKLDEKYSEGFHNSSGSSEATCENETELRQKLGRALLPNLSAPDVTHVDPDFDTRGMKKERPMPRLAEDGRLNEETKRANAIKELNRLRELKQTQREEAEIQRQVQELEAEARYIEDETYGAF